MKEFLALQTLAGSYKWQSPYAGEEESERQQGVRFHIQTPSLRRDAALSLVAANLADLGEGWLHPAGPADGPWIIHLDQLTERFPQQLRGQRWLVGDRLVSPEFDVGESPFPLGTQGVVRFTVLPEERGMLMSIPPAPELEPFLAEFRREHPDSRHSGFLMMPFTETPAHRLIAASVREVCESLALVVLRADDRRYAPDLLSNIRTYMHGCGFGIAVFERLTTDQLNPNVALEVGYMMALGKSVCYLKDATLPTLQSDLVGRLYDNFDVQKIEQTLPDVLKKWLGDKGLVG